ncbi:serine/threonine protein kinase [Plesiocystis pacifica]|nr:protein kinase [Plesiocystis pacifica]
MEVSSHGETFMLGRYVVTGRIASGGMATVYKARLESEGGFARAFALKVIHPHLAEAEGFRERFLDEARVASRVRHPNVVATVDSDQDRGYHFLVLELVDGLTLRQLQVAAAKRGAKSPRLTASEAARVVCDAANGLHAVHGVADEKGESLNVVHRDLSPHNLMLDVTGRTVLIDLGLAKARGQQGHTQTGVLCGKLPYMSPEQSRLEPLDARSDVFSLGSVLFELAVGEAPFGDDHTPGTLEKLRVCDADRLATRMVEADLPSWLTRVVLGCLRAEARDRYATAQDVADALDEGMRRAGVVQSEVRSGLADRVRNLRRYIGVVQPAVPLPPLIAADPTGPQAVVKVGAPSWLRGLAMAASGAAVVLVGLLALNVINGSRAQTQPGDEASDAGLTPATPAADSKGPSVQPQATSADAGPTAESAGAPAQDTTEASPPAEDAGAEAGSDEPPTKRRRPSGKSRSKADLSGFKSNPY